MRNEVRWMQDDIKKIFRDSDEGALPAFRKALSFIDHMAIVAELSEGEQAILTRCAKWELSKWSRWEEEAEKRGLVKTIVLCE